MARKPVNIPPPPPNHRSSYGPDYSSLQGSYMSERVKFKDFLRTFKVMYQQIQGLNTEEKAVEIDKT